MEKNYKRVEQIEDKLHTVKLPYLAWKVFFLVGENTSPQEVGQLLEETEDNMAQTFARLEDEGLITVSAEAPAEEESPVAEEAPAEPEPEALTVEEEPEPEAEPEPEKEQAEEEIIEADLPVPEEAKLETDETEEDLPIEELLTESEEEIEIEIAEKEAEETETESLDLDIDFSAEVEEETTVIEEDKPAEEEPAVTEKEKTAEEPAPPPAPPKEGKAASSTRGILVIDDSIVIRKMVEIALEDEDYEIHTAVSGKEGLAMIDKVNPGLLVLDLVLPDINGIEILKTVKLSRGIPVIMLSGKDSPQLIENAKSEGADAFLPKPFKDDDLVDTIKKLLP